MRVALTTAEIVANKTANTFKIVAKFYPIDNLQSRVSRWLAVTRSIDTLGWLR